MTIALALLAIVLLVVAIAAIVQHHRSRAPLVDAFNRQALTRVVERHEKESVGKE